ncbi:MAG: hypothetical protein K6F43_08260 [Prevotella sp.]|nr:hypothetical protein [Prevotella sp.]
MEEMNFEELRSQFAILKDQLKKQEIVSDHLLRMTMKSKRGNINNTKRSCYVAVVLALLLTPLNYYINAWGLAFSIVTCLMLLFCAAATYYMHKPVDDLNFLTDDFATVARVMARFKKQYNQWLYYVTPVIIPWVGWACYDYGWKHAPEGVNPLWMCVPLLIGAVIGGAIGLYYHFKAVNAAQDILDQIES